MEQIAEIPPQDIAETDSHLKEPGIRELLCAIGVVVLCEFAIAVKFGLFVRTDAALSFDPNYEVPALIYPIQSIVMSCMAAVIAWFYACRRAGKSIVVGLALYRTSAKALGMAVLLAFLGAAIAGLVLSFAPNRTFDDMPLLEGVVDPPAFYLWSFFAMLAPFTEEIFFRAFAFPVLRRRTGFPLALAIVTLFFGLVHAQQLRGHVPTLTPIFIMGFFATALRHFTGSLLPSIVTHFVYNGIIVAASIWSFQSGDAHNVIHESPPTVYQMKMDLQSKVVGKYKLDFTSDVNAYQLIVQQKGKRGEDRLYRVLILGESARGKDVEMKVQLDYKLVEGGWHLDKVKPMGKPQIRGGAKKSEKKNKPSKDP